jgi:conjugative transfer region protein (TIGR03750 family)
VFGKAMTGLGGGLLLTLALVVAGGKVLQRLKRGKPDFYYQTRLGLALHRAGLRDCGLIRYRGVMSLGRTRYHRF